MLHIEIRARENIVIIEPDAEITSDQIKELTSQVNTYINEADQIPKLVIHTKYAPFWASFDALTPAHPASRDPS